MYQDKTVGTGLFYNPRPRRGSLHFPGIMVAGSLAAIDLAIVLGVFGAVAYLYAALWYGRPAEVAESLLPGVLASLVLIPTLLMRRGYSVRNVVSRRFQGSVYLQAWIFSLLVTLAHGFLTKTTADFSRAVLLLDYGPGFIAAYGLRMLAFEAVRSSILGGRIALAQAMVLHVGSAEGAEQTVDRLLRNGVATVALRCIEPAGAGTDVSSERLQDAVGLARHLLAERAYDAIYLSARWTHEAALRDLRALLRAVPVPVVLMPDEFVGEILTNRTIELADLSGFEIQRAPLSVLERALKRGLDIFVAGLALLILSPALVGLGLAVRLTSPGPILFRQARCGFGGRRFAILKFRSMTVCEDGPVVTQARRGDTRLTRIGAFLRSHSLDELPQLWNVLRGEMSLVGPRPHAVAHDNLYDPLIRSYALRQHVKPGITGWAQVNGWRGETRDVCEMEARVRHDLWYIDNYSFGIDLLILLRTVILSFGDQRAY